MQVGKKQLAVGRKPCQLHLCQFPTKFFWHNLFSAQYNIVPLPSKSNLLIKVLYPFDVKINPMVNNINQLLSFVTESFPKPLSASAVKFSFFLLRVLANYRLPFKL